MTQPLVLGTTLRDESDAISPSWWNGPNGQRVRYALSTPLDALLDAYTYATYAMTATYGPSDALTWIGQDRLIIQGFQQSLADYRERLVMWLDIWPYAGKPTGVMLAVQRWILPQLPQIQVVTNSSVWYAYGTGSDEFPPGQLHASAPQQTIGANNWNWDNLGTPGWFRSWLIIQAVAPSPTWITMLGNWGSGLTWGQTTICWGLNCAANIPLGLATLVKQWKRAGCWYQWIIISFNAAEWNSEDGSGGGVNPDGTFARWSKIVNGNYVQARFTDSRYIAGIP